MEHRVSHNLACGVQERISLYVMIEHDPVLVGNRCPIKDIWEQMFTKKLIHCLYSTIYGNFLKIKMNVV